MNALMFKVWDKPNQRWAAPEDWGTVSEYTDRPNVFALEGEDRFLFCPYIGLEDKNGDPLFMHDIVNVKKKGKWVTCRIDTDNDGLSIITNGSTISILCRKPSIKQYEVTRTERKVKEVKQESMDKITWDMQERIMSYKPSYYASIDGSNYTIINSA